MFHLIDLVSQGAAVQRLLAGKPIDEKLAWLSRHALVSRVPVTDLLASPVFHFESPVGLDCMFFFSEDRLVFIGDNTTFLAPDNERLSHSKHFINPMWDSEADRTGKQISTPLGYALRLIANLIGRVAQTLRWISGWQGNKQRSR